MSVSRVFETFESCFQRISNTLKFLGELHLKFMQLQLQINRKSYTLPSLLNLPLLFKYLGPRLRSHSSVDVITTTRVRVKFANDMGAIVPWIRELKPVPSLLGIDHTMTHEAFVFTVELCFSNRRSCESWSKKNEVFGM